MKHTPGPWIKSQSYIIDENRREIARIPLDEQTGYRQANLRLIAAAPDLFEALKALFDCIMVHKRQGADDDASAAIAAVAAAEAAIAKAEGEEE